MYVSTIHEEIDFRHAGGVHIAPVFGHFEEEMVGSHWHEELELVYTVYGCSRHIINGEVYPVGPGQLVIINSGFVHSVIPQAVPRGDTPLKALVILVSRELLDIAFPQYDAFYFTNDDRNATEEMDRIILKLLLRADRSVNPAGAKRALNPLDGLPYEEIDEEMAAGHPDAHRQEVSSSSQASAAEMLQRNALVMELLSLLAGSRMIRRSEAAISDHMKAVDQIKQMILYVDQHYAEPLTRRDMANAFYISPNYFSTYFHQYVGIPFKQYLRDYRLNRSVELLLSTDHSVNHIAEEVGFSDDQSYIIAFRKKFLLTPLQYRKQHAL